MGPICSAEHRATARICRGSTQRIHGRVSRGRLLVSITPCPAIQRHPAKVGKERYERRKCRVQACRAGRRRRADGFRRQKAQTSGRVHRARRAVSRERTRGGRWIAHPLVLLMNPHFIFTGGIYEQEKAKPKEKAGAVFREGSRTEKTCRSDRHPGRRPSTRKIVQALIRRRQGQASSLPYPGPSASALLTRNP